MKSITRAMVALAAVSGAATSVARADAPNLAAFPDAPVFTALSDNVTVTFLFSRASFTNYLVLFDAIGGTGQVIMTVPGAYPNIGTPNEGTTVNITGLTIGQSLLFGLCSDGATTGGSSTICNPLTGEATSSWYIGPVNADGQVHAKFLPAATWNSPINDFCDDVGEVPALTPTCGVAPAGTTVVGFEDKVIPNNEFDEPDYNDIVFAFSNVSTVVPEPATMGLLALGLVGMSGAGLLRRRNRKNNK